MTAKPALRAVEPQAEEPAPSYAYEAQERRKIMARDWAKVHIAADRRAPVSIPDRNRRTWL